MRNFTAVYTKTINSLPPLKDFDYDPVKDDVILRALTSEATQKIRPLYFLRMPGFLYISPTGHLHTAVCPTVIGNTVVASAHDNLLQEASPLIFDINIQTTGVVTLCDSHSAATHKYKFVEETECSVPDAKKPDGTTKPTSIPHFQTGNVPVFTYFPIIFPLAPSAKYPKTFDFNETFPADTPDWTPQLVDWLKGMYFLYHHNGKCCLTAVINNARFFHQDTVDIAEFAEFDLVDDITTATTTLDPFASDYKAFKTEWQTFRANLAVTTLGNSSEPITATNPANSTPSSGMDPATFAQALATANAKTTTKSERNTAKLTAMIENYWRLFLCSIEPDAAGIPQVHPAQLSDDFTHLLQTSSIKDSLEIFHRTFPASLPTLLNGDHVYDACFDWDAELMGLAFVAAIRGFKFTTKNLNQEPGDADSKLSILPFIPPDHQSISYREARTHTATILCQEAVGEAASKVSTKRTTIPHGTRITTFHDITTTFANWRAFDLYCHRMTDNKSYVLKLMDRIHSALRQTTAKAWINHHSSQYQIPIHLINEINAMMQFMAKVAQDPKVQNLLTTGQPIPFSAFKTANDLIERAVDRFNLAIHIGTLEHFSTHCALLTKLRPDLGPPCNLPIRDTSWFFGIPFVQQPRLIIILSKTADLPAFQRNAES